MKGWKRWSRLAASALAAAALSGCAGSYEAYRSNQTYTADNYLGVKPMASADDALKVFRVLKPYYSGGEGYHILAVMADPSNVRFHESAIVTEQREEVTESKGHMWFGLQYVPDASTATTTRNVDVSRERNIWIPVGRIASLGVGEIWQGPMLRIRYENGTGLVLKVSDADVARKLADALATLKATHYDGNFRFVPDTGLFTRRFVDNDVWTAQAALAGECARLAFPDCKTVPFKLVDGVAPGSPAAALGLQTDDLIIGIDGRPAADFDKVVADKIGHQAEAAFDIKIFRAGRTQMLKMTMKNPVYAQAKAWAEAKPTP